MKYGQKIFNENKFDQLIRIFSNVFPKWAKLFRVKVIPPDVANFFYDVVNKTVTYRETNNIVRNDVLQLLIDIKNKSGRKSTDTEGKYSEIILKCYQF